MEFLFELCLWLSGKLTGRSRDNPSYEGWREREASRGILGMALFFGLAVGVPILVVVLGYATGQLPAASPYED
jgi:hypothetical protein